MSGRVPDPDPAAWGLPACQFETLAGGSRNTTILGRSEDGAAYVFKTTLRSEAQLVWLGDIAPRLRGAGVLFTFPIPTLDDSMSHEGWTVEPYVPGRKLLPGDRMRLSNAVRRMHRIAAGLPQRPGFSSARDLLHHVAGGDIDLDQMPDDVVAQCRRAFAAVPSIPQTVIHGDFTRSNVAVAGTGQFVFYDWDEARVDHPLFDLIAIGLIDHPVPRRAALAFEVACCWHREPDRAKELAGLL